MEKKKLFLRIGILTATVLLTACASSDEQDFPSAVLNGHGQDERGVVKTEFSISFPQKVGGKTRMTDATVQATGQPFRGIRDIKLYPFLKDSTAIIAASATEELPTPIYLHRGTAISQNGASSTAYDNAIANGALYTNTNSHLYQNVDIAIGTKAFMFYGVADYSETSNIPAKYGSLEKTESTTLGGIKFSPDVIYDATAVNATGDSIATYLTSIANTSTWATTTNVGLKALYEKFTAMKAGSFTNARAAVQKLYKELNVDVTGDIQATKDLKDAIKSAITNADYGVTADGEGNLTFTKMIQNSYPKNIGLPDGAAYINWQLKTGSTTDYEFKALFDNDNTGINAAALNSYVYPAPLFYYVLSDIKTSLESKASLYETYASTSGKTWKDITDSYTVPSGYDNTTVTSKTRSIAIKNQVQYAVGRLDVTVKANATTLGDNNTQHSFNVSSGYTSFPVTAILVNGQKPVDFKFEQITTESNMYTVYDTIYYQKNDAKNIYLTSGESNAMHTLVFETKAATATNETDAVAKIAVEFLNNTTDTIVGENNELIYPGCKFYLVGTLDPALNDGTSTSGHTNFKDAKGNLIKKAFVQDHTTTANLVIQSLKHAYNTLPDLTLPKLELGLSVDLTWQTGITQTITIE